MGRSHSIIHTQESGPKDKENILMANWPAPSSNPKLKTTDCRNVPNISVLNLTLMS